ncbi:MAG: amino acid permease [Firmicutes bacterium]|nr:amino acid permease [Bacillota bacterium]
MAVRKAPEHARQARPRSRGPRRTLGTIGLTGLGIGGIIGAGFFLGSGIVIHRTGPGIVLTYLLAGIILAQVMGAITSLAVNVPVESSYQEYIHRYLGPFAGFLLGWVVYLSGILATGSEAVAMAVYSQTWLPGVPLGVYAVSYVLVIVGLNLFGVADLGKAETGMSLLKVGVLLAFILTAALLLGHLLPVPPAAGPAGLPRPGTFLPRGPGAVLQAMLIVIFSYAGVTTVAMAASRTRRPGRTVPQAALYTTVGVVLLYALSVAGLVLLLPYTRFSPQQSPFVTALRAYHLIWFARVFNAAVLVASFSVMAGTFYATEWMLISMALHGGAPSYFRHAGPGRPYRALITTALLVLATVSLAFVLPRSVYTELTAASSYFSFINWMLILLAFTVWHRRARRPREPVSALAFGAPYGAWVMAAAIAALGIYSLTIRSFRPAFLVFAALTLGVTLSWMWLQRRPAA